MKRQILRKLLVFALMLTLIAGVIPNISDISAATKPKKPMITVSVNENGSSVTVTIGKTKRAEGYQVMVKLPGAKKYKELQILEQSGKKKRTFTVDILNAGVYYIKVRAYKNNNGNKVWGKYSTAQTVIIEGKPGDGNTYSVGDIVQFGSFETDNNLENGKEPLEWVVLSNDGSELFLVTRHIISEADMKTSYYGTEDGNSDKKEKVSWENRYLRAYLNGDFIKETFNDKEAAIIADTELTDVNTVDKVFLLSENEMNKNEGYFCYTIDTYRRCGATMFAISEHDFDGDGCFTGVWTCGKYMDNTVHKARDGAYACYWWLRTPGEKDETFRMVSETGAVITVDYDEYEIETVHRDEDDGEDFYAEGFGLRPALKVKLTDETLGLLKLTGENDGIDVTIKIAGSTEDNIVDISEAKQGDIITFGTYEQDNDTENGAESIRWIVLKRTESELLVMSKYGLDSKPYHAKAETWIRWKKCSLRKWLNNDFYNTAFTDAEKEKINTKKIKNGKNPVYPNFGKSAATEDKVFLLSLEEATNASYGFSKDRKAYDDLRKCAPTEYALANGAEIDETTTSEGLASGLWWLRTVGYNAFYAVYVIGSGYIRADGWDTDEKNIMVRPVIEISLK